MELEHEHRFFADNSEHVSYSVSQLPKFGVDEDKFCFSLRDENLRGLSSFGLFDGHGGEFAAKICSEFLHKNIYNQFCDLVNNSRVKDGFDDRLFCRAIRMSIMNIDDEARSYSKAGTTAVSLFISQQKDMSHRVICPWIGDSRCCMYQMIDGQEASAEITQDHKPDVERERRRIESGGTIVMCAAPIEISNDDIKKKKNLSIIINEFSSRKNSIFKMEKIETVETLCDSPPSIRRSARKLSIETVVGSSSEDIEEDSIPSPLLKKKSYIDARRAPGCHTVGPLAVFGTNGISLCMTRSIGDKHGPRSCVAVPDITATTIPPNTHARFVIASDGMWDVFSIEDVRKIVLRTALASDAAVKLSHRARELRISRGLRMDDITVMVIDVNPQNFVASKKFDLYSVSNCVMS